jgi:hypothetical protein
VDRDVPAATLLRRADRAAVVMLGGALLATLAATGVVPVLGGVLAPGYALSTTAVLGWGAYAASCAAVLPYGSLAAVRGRQAAVLVLRVADSALSLLVVAVALLVVGAPSSAAPWLLAVGSFAGGALCRRVLLLPLVAGASVPPEPARQEVAA